MPPKSGFSRAKTVDYDDDDMYDDDDYYEEEGGEGAAEEMTEEDKEQMAIGTAKVKEALGSQYKVKEVDIQDALWNYFYDVGKTVTYLKSMFGRVPDDSASVAGRLADVEADKFPPKAQTQTPAKPKAASRFDQAAGAADAKAPTSGKHMTYGTESTVCTAEGLGQDLGVGAMRTGFGYPLPHQDEPTRSRASLDYVSTRTKNFFWDVPWGGVPSSRLANITVEPAYRGGLLGGSSKLAALAAKRKQKQQEEAAKADTAANGETADKAVALLDRLNLKERPAISTREDAKPRYPRKREETPPPAPEPVEEEPAPEPEQPRIQFPNLRAKQPSMFGAILCGEEPEPMDEQHVANVLTSFPLPYANSRAYLEADPFSKPSPDDVVRQAQARSAGAGR